MKIEIEQKKDGIEEFIPVFLLLALFTAYGYIAYPVNGTYGAMVGLLTGLICLLSLIPFAGHWVAMKAFDFSASMSPYPAAFAAVKPVFNIVSVILCIASSFIVIVFLAGLLVFLKD